MTKYYKVPVIYYHSIGPVNYNWAGNFLTLSESIFEEHLKWISKCFSVISLSDYWQIRHGLMNPVKNPLIITFDDGYLDNWIWAFPLLKKYGLKATIFINPEFVDNKAGIRRTLEDYEEGRVSLNDIAQWGFLSWDEMRIMEKSGLIDIQSHALTHTKYFVSDRLTGFHHPGADILFPAGNLHPERKPYYIGDPGFERLLPFGFPLFEEKPSLIAKKIEINPAFVSECIETFKDYDFTHYNFASAYEMVKPIISFYKGRGELISGRESEEEYLKRVRDELRLSKKVIEEKLDKKVEFLCWPHGGNNDLLHNMALEEGYLMTTAGKAKGVTGSNATRVPDRIVIDFSKPFKKMRTFFKVKAFSGYIPYSLLLNTYRRLLSPDHKSYRI